MRANRPNDALLDKHIRRALRAVRRRVPPLTAMDVAGVVLLELVLSIDKVITRTPSTIPDGGSFLARFVRAMIALAKSAPEAVIAAGLTKAPWTKFNKWFIDDLHPFSPVTATRDSREAVLRRLVRRRLGKAFPFGERFKFDVEYFEGGVKRAMWKSDWVRRVGGNPSDAAPQELLKAVAADGGLPLFLGTTKRRLHVDVHRLRDRFEKEHPMPKRMVGGGIVDQLAEKAGAGAPGGGAKEVPAAQERRKQLQDFRERVMGTGSPAKQAAWENWAGNGKHATSVARMAKKFRCSIEEVRWAKKQLKSTLDWYLRRSDDQD